MNKDIIRIYLRALSNGYLIDADNKNYQETQYAFSTWDEVVEWVKNNPPSVNIYENRSVDAAEVPAI